MKHIFITENHITFYIALSIQSHLKLKDEDIIFITTKEYDNLTAYPNRKKIVKLMDRFFHRGMLKKNHSLIDFSFFYRGLRQAIVRYFKMKKIIDEQVIPKHEPYILYVEHFFSALRGFLGSAPNCISCNLMEEGTLSYMKKYWCEYGVRRRYLEGNFKRRFKSKLVTRGHFFRYLFKIYSFPANKEISAYGINEECFPNPELIKNTIIPFYKDKQVDLSQIPDNATIFFMELTIDLLYFEDNDAFWDKLTEVLPFIKAEELYVKFHLRNTSQTRERLTAILEASGRNYTILPDSLPTEQVFLHKKNLKIYGLRTSCLLYGSLLKGGTVLSFEDFFIHLYKETLLIEDALRLLLEKHINFLKPEDFPKTLS